MGSKGQRDLKAKVMDFADVHSALEMKSVDFGRYLLIIVEKLSSRVAKR